MSTTNAMSASLDDEKKRQLIEKHKRQREIERAKAARARDSNRTPTMSPTSTPSKDAIKSNSQAAALAMRTLAPPSLTDITSPATKQDVERELAELRSRKITTSFYQHYSSIIDTISKERAAAEAALAEFERKKAENAAYYAARNELPPTTILSAMEKISLELKRRREEVRKKEDQTQQWYNRYAKHMSKGGIDFDSLPPLPEEIVRQVDLWSKVEQENETNQFRSRNTAEVYEAKQKYESTPPSRSRKKAPRSNWTPTAFRGSPLSPGFESIQEETNELLLAKARQKAESADQDGIVEESKLQADLAEQNAYNFHKAMTAWFTNGGIDTPPTMDDEWSELGGSEEGDSELAKNLADLLIQEKRNFNQNTDDGSVSVTSQSLQESQNAAIAAEKAAKDMAEQCSASLTSSITDTHQQSQVEEKWYAYWSEEHKKEYYYEPKSGRVTWTPPDQFSVTSSFNGRKDADTKSDSATSYQQKKRNVPKSDATVYSHYDGSTVHSYSVASTVANQSKASRDGSYEWSASDFQPGADPAEQRAIRERRRASRKKRRRKRFIRRMLWSITFVSICGGVSYYIYKNGVPENVRVLGENLLKMTETISSEKEPEPKTFKKNSYTIMPKDVDDQSKQKRKDKPSTKQQNTFSENDYISYKKKKKNINLKQEHKKEELKNEQKVPKKDKKPEPVKKKEPDPVPEVKPEKKMKSIPKPKEERNNVINVPTQIPITVMEEKPFIQEFTEPLVSETRQDGMKLNMKKLKPFKFHKHNSTLVEDFMFILHSFSAAEEHQTVSCLADNTTSTMHNFIDFSVNETLSTSSAVALAIPQYTPPPSYMPSYFSGSNVGVHSMIDQSKDSKMKAAAAAAAEDQKKKKPKICNIPLLKNISKKCRKLAKGKG